MFELGIFTEISCEGLWNVLVPSNSFYLYNDVETGFLYFGELYYGDANNLVNYGKIFYELEGCKNFLRNFGKIKLIHSYS